MSYVYVYAPVTGLNWGQATYCSSGGAHTVVSCLGGCCPIDISGSQGNSIYFYGSADIKSIRTTRVSRVCADTTLIPWTDGVVVDIYGQLYGQCYLGSVGYGHLEERVADGLYNSNTLKLGKLPANCNCGCSSGIHVHMQRTNGSSNSFSCYQQLYAGSTWVYRWNAVC